MTRRRLRPGYDQATLARLYRRPYRAAERGLGDHIERVAVTAGLVAGVMRRYQLTSLADLSTGAGELPLLVRGLLPTVTCYLGDYTAAPGLTVVGPIEETIQTCPQVDLFVCAETLEHLDDPDAILRAIHAKAHWLVLTTPIGEETDANPEHYWSWDLGDLLTMFIASGWRAKTSGVLEPAPGYYRFQLWAASRRDEP